MRKRKIAITMGDPAGIGPEIIAKAVTTDQVREKIIPVIIGNQEIMEEAIRMVGSKMHLVTEAESAGKSQNSFQFIQVGTIPMRTKREISAEGGDLSVACIKKAVEMCVRHEVDAMVTAPISKEALHLAGYHWPGHTEMLAEFTNSQQVAMLFVGERLKVILATIHTPLREAIALITKERILETIHLAQKACAMFALSHPRLAVAGLNPHAGEGGIFGDEESRHIAPAIEKAREEGININGPYPPDIIFKRAYDGEFDIVIALYHDQGLIPFKMLYFDTGVNVTVGLPIVRTSPDHGTAVDIAWKGRANPSSMIQALLIAERLIHKNI